MGVNIREKPKGSGVWWIFINYHGRRKSKKIGSENLARDVAEKIKAKLVLGDLSVVKTEPQTPIFKQYAETWLNLPHDWKESTRETYGQNLKWHIYPAIGKLRLDEITRKTLKGFFDKLLVKGLSSSTITLIRAPISGILVHAVDSELIQSNPLKELTLKYKRKTLEIDPLTEAETILLLTKAKEYLGGGYYPCILCALRTGMRIGEIQALKWGNIDLNGQFIEVKRSWRKGRITDTKSRKRRQVDMTPHLAETLKALQVTEKKRSLKQGRPVSEWVFTKGKGEMLSREMFNRALEKCLSLAGLRKIRVHDLRHSYATIRLLRGHNVGDISYQLGHSSISITYDTYGHWMPGKFKSEVNELDMPQPSAPYAQPESPSSGIIKSFQ